MRGTETRMWGPERRGRPPVFLLGKGVSGRHGGSASGCGQKLGEAKRELAVRAATAPLSPSCPPVGVHGTGVGVSCSKFSSETIRAWRAFCWEILNDKFNFLPRHRASQSNYFKLDRLSFLRKRQISSKLLSLCV